MCRLIRLLGGSLRDEHPFDFGLYAEHLKLGGKEFLRPSQPQMERNTVKRNQTETATSTMRGDADFGNADLQKTEAQHKALRKQIKESMEMRETDESTIVLPAATTLRVQKITATLSFSKELTPAWVLSRAIITIQLGEKRCQEISFSEIKEGPNYFWLQTILKADHGELETLNPHQGFSAFIENDEIGYYREKEEVMSPIEISLNMSGIIRRAVP
jgi:hypothetical protein